MRFLSNIPALTTFIILLFVPFVSISLEFQQNELTKAIQLFDKRRYEEAEILFQKLLKERPEDFMINYFFGACRTENGHYSDRDLAYLLKASKEVSPLDIDYYFGVQYQAKKDWAKALFYYGIYGKTANEEEQKRVSLAKRIDQCKNQINPFTRETEISFDSIVETKPVITEISNIQKSDSVNINQPGTMEQDSDYVIQENEKPETTYNDRLKEIDSIIYVSTSNSSKSNELPVYFNINSEISYNNLSNFRTREGKQLFEQGNNKQQELNTVLGTAKNLRTDYVSAATQSVKDSLGLKIMGLENRSIELKNEINQFYARAKQTENDYWNKATEDEKATFLVMLKNADKQQDESETPSTEDKSALEIPKILVNDKSPINKSTKQENKDLTYKIQIGAYSRGLPLSTKKLFDKLSLIRKIENYTDENGVVVYTTGNLTKFDNALQLLKQVQQEGVEDAIIAAYYKGKRIPLTEAKELEGIK